MFCKQCGCELPDGTLFCTECGTMHEQTTSENVTSQEQAMSGNGNAYGQAWGDNLSAQEQAWDDNSSAQGQVSEEQNQINTASSRYSRVFVDPDEQLQGTLGNGYLENLLHKKVKKCNALLTDRRVYFQGRFFSGSGKKLVQSTMEMVVDVEDITGTKFIYRKPVGRLAFLIPLILTPLFAIIGGLLLIIGYNTDYPIDEIIETIGIIILSGSGVSLVTALIGFLLYIINRKVYFAIEYAGGSIKFNATIIGLAAVQDFQKQIRRVKDAAKRRT